MAEANELIAERYELRDVLGVGGMARVYDAWDLRLQRRVAVKILLPTIAHDPAARERFAREARAAARLQHPSVVRVFDVETDASPPFLVLEHVDGPTLAQRVRADGPLPVADVVTIGADVLAALEAAHAAGIVHRDVKPGNVLLDAGRARLTDFGIAKALDVRDQQLTAVGQVMGTPRYLAPEVASGGGAGAASDVYSTGIVLYEALVGRAPFDGSTPFAVAAQHRDAPVPDPSVARPDVPRAVARVVTTALAKRPEDRFPSASAMRDALLAASPGAVGATAEAAARATPRLEQTVVLSAAPDAPREAVQHLDGARQGRLPWAVAAGAAALVATGAVLALRGGDAPAPPSTAPETSAAVAAPAALPPTTAAEPSPPAPGTTTSVGLAPLAPAPQQSAPPVPPPDTTPRGTTELLGQDLASIVDALSADPALGGRHAEDLLRRATALLEAKDTRDVQRAARQLSDRLSAWTRDGSLDQDVAQAVAAAAESHVANATVDQPDEGDDDEDEDGEEEEDERPGGQGRGRD